MSSISLWSESVLPVGRSDRFWASPRRQVQSGARVPVGPVAQERVVKQVWRDDVRNVSLRVDLIEHFVAGLQRRVNRELASAEPQQGRPGWKANEAGRREIKR